MEENVTEGSWEIGVSCGEEWKEESRSYHLFLGKEDSGCCGFTVCYDVFAGGTTLFFFLPFSFSSLPASNPGMCGAPSLVLDPAWLDPKKKYCMGPLLCARHFKSMITLDPVQRVRSPPFYRRGN